MDMTTKKFKNIVDLVLKSESFSKKGNGIKKMPNDYPVMLYQTTVKAKLYLGQA